MLTNFVIGILTSLPMMFVLAGIAAGGIGGTILKVIPFPWSVVARAAGYVALVLVSVIFGYRLADERATTNALRQHIAVLERDRDVQKRTANFYANWVRKFEADTAAKDKEIEAYEQELKKRPNNACLLTPADLGLRGNKQRR